MTPQFYARYVPRSTHVVTTAKVSDDLEAARPTKKRRKRDDESIEDVSALKDINWNGTLGPNGGAVISDGHKAAENGQRIEASSSTLANGVRSSKQIEQKPIQPPQRKSKKMRDLSLRTNESTSTSTNQKESQNGQQENPKPLAEEGKKKERKKKKKQKQKHVENSQAGHGGDANVVDQELGPRGEEQNADELKHVKVLSKYQKSVKAAAGSAEVDEITKDNQDLPAVPLETHGLTPIPQPPQAPDAARPSTFAALPAWLTEPIVASGTEGVTFDTLPIDSSTLTSLRNKGYTEAFTIQAVVLPLLLPGERQHHGDLCISASTGSGKTLAYALPMVEALREKSITRLRGLIIVPTRELVNQAHETLELCSSGSGLKVGTAYGSKTLRQEQEALITRQHRYDPEAYQRKQDREVDEDEELLNWDSDAFGDDEQAGEVLMDYVVDHMSKVDILICTPGRLIEHLQHTRGFTLDHVQWLVIDEADRLLDESFQQWVENVMPALEHQNPPDLQEMRMMQRFHLLRKRELRKIILSASMTRDISKLKELKLQRPKLVVLKNERQPPQTNEETADQIPELESGEQVELPPTLREIAIQIKDEENKPLYLIELLDQLSSKNIRTSGQRLRSKTRISRNSTTSDSSDSDSVSFNSTSSSSAHSLWASSGSDSESDLPPTTQRLDTSASSVHGSLIFTHSTASAHRLLRLLAILSPLRVSSTATMTKSSAKTSKKILAQFQAGTVDTIISTDRASRGLDIVNLAQVINYDMPSSVNSYIHRVGRTARAGKGGAATTLVEWKEGRWFWNEIGRGSGIQRGGRKITRQKLKDEGWGKEELTRYADALKQLGEETQGE